MLSFSAPARLPVATDCSACCCSRGNRPPRHHNITTEHIEFPPQAHIKLLPGLGHTSSTPFDRDYGWYRYPRCLAGAIGYTVRRRTWTAEYHAEFPALLQTAMRTMLLCHTRAESGGLAAAR